MTKPTEKVEWASDAGALKTVTSTARRDYGWTTDTDLNTGVGEKPDIEMQNYWQYAVYKWIDYLQNPTPSQPLVGATDLTTLQEETEEIQDRNSGIEFGYSEITTTTATSGGVPTLQYEGGVYNPSCNKIFLIPNYQSTQTTWHYIDCNSGKIVPYVRATVAIEQSGFKGGAYDARNNRIFMAPYMQAIRSIWQYIDCNTTLVTSYTAPPSIAGAYYGAVYDPVREFIYFIPNAKAPSITWHYIDCNTSQLYYTWYHQLSTPLVANAYRGGCYSPSQRRIYMAPSMQAAEAKWHYIDCTEQKAYEYDSPSGVGIGAYEGAVFSPLQNRIYFMPSFQSSSTTWHYIDCDTGDVVGYTTPSGMSAEAFKGGCYSPQTNRIYLAPNIGAHATQRYYIDCTPDTPSVVQYDIPSGTGTGDFYGAVYSPSQSRAYFLPWNSTSYYNMGFIQEYGEPISKQYIGNTLFNTGN